MRNKMTTTLLAALGCVLFMACGSSGNGDGEFDACLELDGRTYLSVDQYECGLGPDGPEFCNWTISFAAGEFDWSYSDIASTGTYTCDGAVVIGMSSATQFDAFLDEETGILTWNSIDYRPASE